MEVNAIVNLIKDTGVTIFVVGYFAWINTKYLAKIDSTMNMIKEFIMDIKQNDK